MTDKERLEKIKQDVKMTRRDLAVSPSNEITLHMDIMLNSMNYLIEQAERVQELENLKDAFDDLDSDYIDLHQENKRYRDALEFYGNKENYLHELPRLKATNYSKVMDDYGEIARKALRSD